MERGRARCTERGEAVINPAERRGRAFHGSGQRADHLLVGGLDGRMEAFLLGFSRRSCCVGCCEHSAGWQSGPVLHERVRPEGASLLCAEVCKTRGEDNMCDGDCVGCYARTNEDLMNGWIAVSSFHARTQSALCVRFRVKTMLLMCLMRKSEHLHAQAWRACVKRIGCCGLEENRAGPSSPYALPKRSHAACSWD